MRLSLGQARESTTHVKSFKLDGRLLDHFFAYPGYFVGTDVAAGDVDGDGLDDIVTSPAMGSAHIKVFKPSGEITNNFFAYSGFYGGTRVDVGNVRATTIKEEILTAPLISSKNAYESWWIGGYDVAASDGFSIVSTGGNRRASVRVGPN
jgi:hypothetical protein